MAPAAVIQSPTRLGFDGLTSTCWRPEHERCPRKLSLTSRRPGTWRRKQTAQCCAGEPSRGLQGSFSNPRGFGEDRPWQCPTFQVSRRFPPPLLLLSQPPTTTLDRSCTTSTQTVSTSAGSGSSSRSSPRIPGVTEPLPPWSPPLSKPWLKKSWRPWRVQAPPPVRHPRCDRSLSSSRWMPLRSTKPQQVLATWKRIFCRQPQSAVVSLKA
mmetsp:Transcript_17367/g.50705  ORF Transcript_17367/g.50705 Transcript_17367/m.50705 type:complete len:211 (-) Transcript_17367:394-1026(-)